MMAVTSCNLTRNESDKIECFFKELDDFEIQLPGSKKVSFSDDEDLMEMVERQYPGWKDNGEITSVPVARVPKVFLENFQMHEELQKKFKPTEKGEKAEKALYNIFVDGSFVRESGMIIFPNVDGSHLFDAQIAKVEIDMVLVHSKKGIFVFNVKNKFKKGTSVQKIENHIEKHKRFLHLLMSYKSAAVQLMPIHTVVCDFANAGSKFRILEREKQLQNDEKVIVLDKTELNSSNFCNVWKRKLSDREIGDVVWSCTLDVFVARLIALALIEGSSVLIHDLLKKGLMQSVSRKEDLESLVCSTSGQEKGMRDCVVQHSQVVSHKGKRKFILWTREQMQVIANVYRHLTESPEKGIRLLIKGGKGSGKTMLLIVIAKIIAEVLEAQTGKNENKVLVATGTNSSVGLKIMLNQAFSSTNIVVHDPSRRHLFDEFPFSDILLCDETTPDLYAPLEKLSQTKQHILLFSSERKTRCESGFEVMYLSSNLRSTYQIAEFANLYKHRAPINVLLARPNSKLCGEQVKVRFVEFDPDKQDRKEMFLAECLETIEKFAEKSINEDLAVVVPMIESLTLHRIISKLTLEHYVCYTKIEMYNRIKENMAVQNRNSTVLFFCEPEEIEGCEFASILILLDTEFFGMVNFSSDSNDFLTAITRASLRLDILVTNFIIPDDEYVDKYSLSNHEETFIAYIRKISIIETRNPTFLFIGKFPNLPKWKMKKLLGKNLPKINGMSLYQGRDYLRLVNFLYIDDLFSLTHANEVYEWGVHEIFLVNENVTCPWQYLFYSASMICLKYFEEKIHTSSFVYGASNSNRDLVKYQTNILTAILQKQSGISDVIIPETWLDLESSPIPLTEKLSWHKWAAKAKELYRIGETAAAAVMFECSIKSLKQKLKANIVAKEITSVRNDKTELVTLSINLSKIYIEDTTEIVQGTKQSYHFPTYLPADCLIYSFRHAIKAVELQINWTQSIDMLETVFERLRSYFDDGGFKLALAAQISQERMGLHPKIFQQKSQCRSDFICVASKKEQINLLIKEMQNMRISNETRARLTELKKNISSHAMEAAQETLGMVLETSPEDPNTDKFGLYLDHMMQLFEYPVQFALMAMHWNPSDDENHQVYSLALDRLENAINYLKKHVNEGLIVSEQKAQERPGTKKIGMRNFRVKSANYSYNFKCF